MVVVFVGVGCLAPLPGGSGQKSSVGVAVECRSVITCIRARSAHLLQTGQIHYRTGYNVCMYVCNIIHISITITLECFR